MERGSISPFALARASDIARTPLSVTATVQLFLYKEKKEQGGRGIERSDARRKRKRRRRRNGAVRLRDDTIRFDRVMLRLRSKARKEQNRNARIEYLLSASKRGCVLYNILQ